jgi:hypothetical protein
MQCPLPQLRKTAPINLRAAVDRLIANLPNSGKSIISTIVSLDQRRRWEAAQPNLAAVDDFRNTICELGAIDTFSEEQVTYYRKFFIE